MMDQTIELLFNGLSLLFQLETLWLLFFGLILGMIAGALPGFTSTNATAIMLPLTFLMSTHGALVFIGALYCGAMYGGAIPAILFQIPGTPGAGATMIDGYPMSQQGKADIALGISLCASSLGGFISAIILIIILPIMVNYALRFGPSELFLISLLGITVIASLSGSGVHMKKGLIAGLLGILVSLIPADPVYVRPRIWFGFWELYDQIPLVPIMMGLYAYPILLSLALKDRVVEVDLEGVEVGSFSKQMEGIKEVFRRPITVIRSVLLGFFIGAIPGTGAGIATFVSYGQAMTWSKHPEKFGKGEPDGIIAAEAANNAVTCGAMIPTFTLGIPGSGTTAMMLVAIIMHNLRPGPQLIRESAEPLYTLLAALLIAPILLLPIGFLFNRLSAKLTLLSSEYLVPSIIAMCIVGSYAVRLFTLDIYISLLFGLIGLTMNRLGYPIIPFVLGIILGPIAEANILRALRISGGDWSVLYGSTICITLWILLIAIIFALIIFPIFRAKKNSSTSA